MAFDKQTWRNYPNTTTPITADELNRIESGIEDVTYLKLLDTSKSIDNLRHRDDSGEYRITNTRASELGLPVVDVGVLRIIHITGTHAQGYMIQVWNTVSNGSWVRRIFSGGTEWSDWEPTTKNVREEIESTRQEVSKVEASIKNSYVDVPVEDYLYVFTDQNGLATDLAVRSSDGQFPDYVIERIQKRLSNLPGTGSRKAKWLHPSGDVVPMNVDLTSWSTWGSSGLALMNPQFKNLANQLDVEHYDGAKGGERSWHTAARLGSDPAVLEFPNSVILATTEPQPVVSENVRPLSAMKTYSGEILGVRGSLSSTNETLIFTRDVAGEEVVMNSPEKFIPDQGKIYRDKPAIIQLGKNDINLEPNSGPGVIEANNRAFDWFSPVEKMVIVMGHHANRDWGPTSTTLWNRLELVNSSLQERYGALYFDLQGFMSSELVWDVTEIEPTSEDLSAQQIGSLPPSLSTDHLHFNEAMNIAIVQQLEGKFKELGWFE